MGLFQCNCRANCTGNALVFSLIAGIIGAFLQITGAVTLTAPFLWALFGIGVGYLGIQVLAAALSRGHRQSCVCAPVQAVLTGALGTVLTAVVLLGVEPAATSVVAAVLTGLLVLFFTLMLTASGCLVLCLADCEGDTNSCPR